MVDPCCRMLISNKIQDIFMLVYDYSSKAWIEKSSRAEARAAGVVIGS